MDFCSSYGYHLPEDVVIDILLRLPVKSLLRFKCVCTQWYDLIESASFISNHFHHESNNARLLVHHQRPDTQNWVTNLFTDETLLKYEEPENLQLPNTAEHPIGPLNGIFCVATRRHHLALWNPATKEFRPLLADRPDIPPNYYMYMSALGLGLVPSTADYKVVWIRYFEIVVEPDDEDNFYEPGVVSVYTLSSDSWRHFEEVDLFNSTRYVYDSLCNIFLDGYYYWLVGDKWTYVTIIAFDMRTEVFKEIQVPNYDRSQKGELALYNNSVALLCYDDEVAEKSIDIWLMEEEGCWTKHIKVGPLLGLSRPYGLLDNKIFLLIRIRPSQEIFQDSSPRSFRKSLRVILHYLDTRETLNLQAHDEGDEFRLYNAYSYKESLVSVKRKIRGQLEDNSPDILKDFFNPDAIR